VNKSAIISECGKYRYDLRRSWGDGDGIDVCFVMLNPSTADDEVDDPTIRRCMGFARDMGATSLTVRNLFAYRATDPKELARIGPRQATGSDNDRWLRGIDSPIIVAAWGAWVPYGRDRTVMREIFRGRPVVALGVTKSGQPRHPLYLPASARPSPYGTST
jgi:hypothetical protein